jgi:hypothetical protein
MPNITNIPSPRVEFIDNRTGLVSREWYRFLLNLFQLTGGGTNDLSLVDQAIAPVFQDPTGSVAPLVDQLSLGRVPYELVALPDDLIPPRAETVVYDDLSPSPELGTMAGQNAEKVAITGGTVTLDGGATLIGTKSALTNGAAAAAGTLLNAPAAGNPTKWIAINDAGTTRYIPAW